MADSEEFGEKLTLERILEKSHKEIGEALVEIGEIYQFPADISNFFQGKGFSWGNFNSLRYRRAKLIGYENLMEMAEHLFSQAPDIWREKGFRFTPSLMTAREHKECSSSGYGKFEVMPDVVIPIANQTLKILEDRETMSIEEIRIARILAGMPTIDNDGKVTGEIVPIPHSYVFIPDEQRAIEIKNMEQQVINGLRSVVYEAVANHVKDLRLYKKTIEELARGEITTASAYVVLDNLRTPQHHYGQFRGIVEDAKKLAYQEGKRDDILIPMELMVLGRDFDEKFRDNPYTPLGIQKGELTIADANKVRAEEHHFDAETELFTPHLMPFSFSLEPLDKEGKTERGPLVLDHETREPFDARAITFFKEKIQKPVPFARQTDWYHKPVA